MHLQEARDAIMKVLIAESPYEETNIKHQQLMRQDASLATLMLISEQIEHNTNILAKISKQLEDGMGSE